MLHSVMFSLETVSLSQDSLESHFGCRGFGLGLVGCCFDNNTGDIILCSGDHHPHVMQMSRETPTDLAQTATEKNPAIDRLLTGID